MGKTNYHLHCEINGREHLGDDTVLLEADSAQLCQLTHFHQKHCNIWCFPSKLPQLLKYYEDCECMKISLKASKPCNYLQKLEKILNAQKSKWQQ